VITHAAHREDLRGSNQPKAVAIGPLHRWLLNNSFAGRFIYWFSFSLLLLLATDLNAQKIIHVPGDAPSIQQAIDGASNGDSVVIAPGTYQENIDFRGKAITVKGASTAGATIINGSAHGPVVAFSSGETRNSVLSNLTIQNGSPYLVPDAGGIYINGSSPTIQNNLIQNNFDCGIGIYNGAPLVQGNTIQNTSQQTQNGCATPTPGAAYAYPARGTGIFMAGYSRDGQQAQFIGNLIQGNKTLPPAIQGPSPAGMYLADAGAPLIKNNVIARNQADEESALEIVGDVAPIVIQNLIYGNVVDESNVWAPGAFFISAVTIALTGAAFRNYPTVIANNTIVDNTYVGIPSINQQGSQLYVNQFYDHVQFTNNIITAPGSASLINCQPSVTPVNLPSFDHNDVFPQIGGAAYYGTCPDPTGSNGNISLDPLFASTNTNTQYPYQLQLQSPAVDAGNNDAPDLSAEDLSGKPRIQNAKGLSLSIIDMGVYEYPGVPIPPPPADFTLKINPSSVRVVTGQQGTVSVTLTPTSSFQGSVALSCGTLPATVSCSFQPQQLDLSSGVTQTAQLIIGTHKVVPSGLITGSHTKGRRLTAVTFLSLLACLLSILLFVPARRANRRLYQLLIIFVTAIILSGLSACGITFNGFPESYSIAVYGKGSTEQITHQTNLGLNLLP